MKRPTLKVFVSSPGDVAEERVISGRIIRRLADRYAHVAQIEPIFWEHEPLLATDSFQAQILPPAEADIVVCILWSRLGTRLPANVCRADGSTYRSGTEYEMENAIEAHRRSGSPDLLVYRKTAEPIISLRDRAIARAALEQSELLDDFVTRQFHSQDGSLRSAFHSFKEAAEFENILELHLNKLIGVKAAKQKATAEPVAPGRVTWQGGSPYRGLESFDFEHEAIFFGRTHAVSGLLRAFQKQAASGHPFVLILGASGSGKSSLARAGLLPMLTRSGVVPGVATWRRAILRPADAGAKLWIAFANALRSPEALPGLVPAGVDEVRFAEMLRNHPERVLSRIDTLLGASTLSARGASRLVLLIDQMEEIFTGEGIIAETRREFFSVVERFVLHGIWVVATLRSDFYHRCAEIPELTRMKGGSGQFDLLPPTPLEIAAIIRQPALAAGLHFEARSDTGERLAEMLCGAASGNPECLPLLQFTLDELYKRRSEEQVLTLAAYRELGEMEGALATRATEVFDPLPLEVQRQLARVFRQLVRIDPEGSSITRRAASLAQIQRDGDCAQLVGAFVEARLLSTKQGADGTPLVEITHEALLRRWDPLQRWLRNDREMLLIRARVSAAAEVWDQNERAADRLLAGGQPTEEAKRLRRAGFDLSDRERAFITASEARARRNRWIRRAALGSLAFLTIVSLFLMILAMRSSSQAEKNFVEARRMVDEFMAGVAREELNDIPGLQELREKLARKALGRYEGFALRRPNDPEVQAGLGLSQAGVGSIMGGSGNMSEAVRLLKQAIVLHEANVVRNPKVSRYQHNLGRAHTDLALVYWEVEERSQARPHVEAAIQILEKVTASVPDDFEARFDLAKAYNTLGNVQRETNVDNADAPYEKSRALFETLLHGHPRKSDVLAGVSAATHNLHLVAKQKHDNATALQLLEKSQEYDRQARALVPLSPRLLSNMTIGLSNRAALLSLMGRRDEARRNHQESVNVSRDVVRGNPRVPRFQYLLASSLISYGDSLSGEEDRLPKRAAYEEAIKIFETLSAQVSDRPLYAKAYLDSKINLAESYAGAVKGEETSERKARRLKSLDEAAALAPKLSAQFPRAAGLQFSVCKALQTRAMIDVEDSREESAYPMLLECMRICREHVWTGEKDDLDRYDAASMLKYVETAVGAAKKLKKPDDFLRFIALAEQAGKRELTREGTQSLGYLIGQRAKLYMDESKNADAIESFLSVLAILRPVLEKNPWHWYIRQSVGGAYMNLGDLYERTGDIAKEVRARQDYLRVWGGPMHGMKTAGYIDPDGPTTEDEAKRLRAFMKTAPGMKRFTIPCDFNGVKYPFHVYITEVPYPKDPLEDQARWLEEERGGKIPEDVRGSFRRLHKIAHDDKVSYQELCVSTLGTVNKKEEKRPVDKKGE